MKNYALLIAAGVVLMLMFVAVTVADYVTREPMPNDGLTAYGRATLVRGIDANGMSGGQQMPPEIIKARQRMARER